MEHDFVRIWKSETVNTEISDLCYLRKPRVVCYSQQPSMGNYSRLNRLLSPVEVEPIRIQSNWSQIQIIFNHIQSAVFTLHIWRKLVAIYSQNVFLIVRGYEQQINNKSNIFWKHLVYWRINPRVVIVMPHWVTYSAKQGFWLFESAWLRWFEANQC